MIITGTGVHLDSPVPCKFVCKLRRIKINWFCLSKKCQQTHKRDFIKKFHGTALFRWTPNPVQGASTFLTFHNNDGFLIFFSWRAISHMPSTHPVSFGLTGQAISEEYHQTRQDSSCKYLKGELRSPLENQIGFSGRFSGRYFGHVNWPLGYY